MREINGVGVTLYINHPPGGGIIGGFCKSRIAATFSRTKKLAATGIPLPEFPEFDNDVALKMRSLVNFSTNPSPYDALHAIRKRNLYIIRRNGFSVEEYRCDLLDCAAERVIGKHNRDRNLVSLRLP
jgi:hypothetical protein